MTSKLEPGWSTETDGLNHLPTIQARAAISAAISLKRIADSLDQLAGNNPEKLSLPDAICNAIEQALANAARR